MDRKSPDPNFAYLITNSGYSNICRVSTYIATDIQEFVQRLDYVPLKLLKAWLPDGVSENTITMQLRSMEAAQLLAYDRKNNAACGKHYLQYGMPAADKIQNELLVPAAAVLCKFKKTSESQELMYYTRTSYPTQIFLVTLDGFAADVTTLQPGFVSETNSMRTVLPKFWAANIPEGEKDNICHIAVVPGNESWSGFGKLLDAARTIGFDAYATFDADSMDATVQNFS